MEKEKNKQKQTKKTIDVNQLDELIKQAEEIRKWTNKDKQMKRIFYRN